MGHTSSSVSSRAGTNTPSDEYDSYRKYRVANTKYVFANTVIRCIHSRILLTECASEEEEVKNVYSANTCGLHIHNKTETPIKTCNVSLAWEPPLKKYNDITTTIIESLK